ncbi:unnamed protein product [Bursaphelenchus xylophilus]|uniref:(pine wood nematode) hypothetical protein n=1 Tax=Bursaphelenchus xylophilus TaxID=6326 RepID=A0A1I7SVJ3_BURXY|nr:unnamed protein product [Bursaphelenchus xylophilus]CAG9101546.1 unnamed protein product [Bursaphelenchus xylophilus]
MTIKSKAVDYNDGKLVLEGYLSQPESATTKLPAVVIYPAFWGITDNEKEVAKELAKLGYVALAASIYEKGVHPKSREEAFGLITPLLQNRVKIMKPRILAAYDFVKAMKNVDSQKISAIGYCFGGACVLDLARYNVDIKVGVSFHGAFRPIKEGEDHSKLKPITTSLLICHGDADEHVNPEVPALLEELRARKADFQFIRYANAKHGFTMQAEPGASDLVGYNEKADKRSKMAMLNILSEVIGVPKTRSPLKKIRTAEDK